MDLRLIMTSFLGLFLFFNFLNLIFNFFLIFLGGLLKIIFSLHLCSLKTMVRILLEGRCVMMTIML